MAQLISWYKQLHFQQSLAPVFCPLLDFVIQEQNVYVIYWQQMFKLLAVMKHAYLRIAPAMYTLISVQNGDLEVSQIYLGICRSYVKFATGYLKAVLTYFR